MKALGCAGILLLVALAIRQCFLHREQFSEEQAWAFQSGKEKDEKCARALETTKMLRIWAAGSLSADGFCHPCSTVPPPTVLYETADAAEILEFGRRLRFRRTPSEPEVANCGPLTFDFIRGEEILHSFNYKGSRLSDESAKQIEPWLQKRDIWSKRKAALEASMNTLKK